MNLQYKFAPLESEVGADGTITGYASKFGVKDQGGDIVVKGAFSRSIGGRLPKMLWQHDPFRPIGVWTEVKEDAVGLMVKGEINLDVRDGAEAYSLIKQGAIEGMSIGYRTKKADRTKAGRELKELDLFEVSLVTFPMLSEATITSVKDIDGADKVAVKRFAEKTLREAGFEADEAKAAAATIAQVREEREAEPDQQLEALQALARDLRR